MAYYEVNGPLQNGSAGLFFTQIDGLLSQIGNPAIVYLDNPGSGLSRYNLTLGNEQYILQFYVNEAYKYFRLTLHDVNMVLLRQIDEYPDSNPYTIYFKILEKDNLVVLNTTIITNNSSISNRGVYIAGATLNNDPHLNMVYPYIKGYSFHKKFFTKRDTQNNMLITPARLLNSNSKLADVWPVSCYYVNSTGLVNRTFNVFKDGDIGYYQDNILYK